jgi:hypothetical protein
MSFSLQLSDVIKDLCARAGIDPAFVDTTGLQGFGVNAPSYKYTPGLGTITNLRVRLFGPNRDQVLFIDSGSASKSTPIDAGAGTYSQVTVGGGADNDACLIDADNHVFTGGNNTHDQGAFVATGVNQGPRDLDWRPMDFTGNNVRAHIFNISDDATHKWIASGGNGIPGVQCAIIWGIRDFSVNSAFDGTFGGHTWGATLCEPVSSSNGVIKWISGRNGDGAMIVLAQLASGAFHLSVNTPPGSGATVQATTTVITAAGAPVTPACMVFDDASNCVIFLMSDGSLQKWSVSSTPTLVATATAPVSGIDIAKSAIAMFRATGQRQSGCTHTDAAFFLWYTNASGHAALAKISNGLVLVDVFDLDAQVPPVPMGNTIGIADMDFNVANNEVFISLASGADEGNAQSIWLRTPVQQVAGYVITNQSEAKAALQNLMAAFFIDCVESDFKLKFVTRGVNAAIVNIPESDLGLEQDSAALTESTSQEQDMPREVSVLFVDPSIDWQQNKAHKHRHRRGIHTKQAITMQLPMVLTPDQARAIAERALYLAYLEGKPFDINLWRAAYLPLDPTDLVTFVYGGVTFQVRIAQNAIGVDFSSQIKTVSEDANNYIAKPAAGTSQAIVPVAPLPPAPTVLFLYDLPYLTDADAVADRSHTGFYIGTSSPVSTWPGCILYKSTDGTNYDAFGSSATLVAYGQVVGTLPDPPALYQWDNTTILTVQMTVGTLTGTTDTAVLNGANVLIVGNEVIQYVNAVQTAPGTFVLTRLLRGRRNTEWAAYGHAASETVVDPTQGFQRVDAPLSLIGITRNYKAVTVGDDISTATAKALTLVPNDLKPASPVQIYGTRAVGDLTIGWTRRTRYAGDWLNNTGSVPLNEDSETYQIDIMNGVTVVRTINWTPGTYDSNGNPTALYTAAQQTTDFGSPQATVTVNIYQISAQIGRGFSGKATV